MNYPDFIVLNWLLLKEVDIRFGDHYPAILDIQVEIDWVQHLAYSVEIRIGMNHYIWKSGQSMFELKILTKNNLYFKFVEH